MTSTSKLHDDVKEVLFSEQEIIDRVKALARLETNFFLSFSL